jgi:glycosyltransferase involved in cell wall biosynthesis
MQSKTKEGQSGPQKKDCVTRPSLLVIDSAYTYSMIKERKLEALLTSRDLDGFFGHIWTVHPVASLQQPEDSPGRTGGPVTYRLQDGHTLIEGTIGRWPWLRSWAIINFLLAQLHLLLLMVKIVRDNHIKVIRSEDALYNGCLGLLLTRLTGAKLLIGVWSDNEMIRKATGRPMMPRLFKSLETENRVEKFVLKRADGVMAGNLCYQNYAVSQGVDRGRTCLFRFGNALNPVHFSDPKERDCGRQDLVNLGTGDEKVLLCISRLEKVKLADHFLLVVHHLRARGWPIKAILAGDGADRALLLDQARELNISDSVVFCGNLDQDVLARVLPIIDAVVSPITGRALTEAALGGAPIAAYDVDWQNELVETGLTGELVEHLQHEQLAQATDRLLRDRDYARAMGAAVRARALAMMNLDQLRKTQTDFMLRFV